MAMPFQPFASRDALRQFPFGFLAPAPRLRMYSRMMRRHCSGCAARQRAFRDTGLLDDAAASLLDDMLDEIRVRLTG
jgi:hypothetical protein